MSAEPPEIKSVSGLHTTWPSAGKSPLGWICIIIGGLVALLTVAAPLAQFFSSKGIGGPVAALPTIFSIALGTWLGSGVYCLLGMVMGGSGSGATLATAIACPKCGQKLPGASGSSRVVCPSCTKQISP